MKTKKTYRSIHSLSLAICVYVEGQPIYVEFNGGFNHPRRQNGSYSTISPKIQTAIEKHPRFKKDFDITKIINLESPKEEAVVTTPDGTNISVPQGSVIVETEEPEKEPEVKEKQDEKYISYVKNGQQAKDELNKKFKVPWSKLKNLTQTLSEAEKLGIVYANWNK